MRLGPHRDGRLSILLGRLLVVGVEGRLVGLPERIDRQVHPVRGVVAVERRVVVGARDLGGIDAGAGCRQGMRQALAPGGQGDTPCRCSRPGRHPARR